MSRSISAYYENIDGSSIDINLGNRDLLGTQNSSMEFWGLPIMKDLGIVLLSELSITDPVVIRGWEELKELDNEIKTLENNIECIGFDEELKTRWVSNLRYCLDKLRAVCPDECVPEFMIG